MNNKLRTVLFLFLFLLLIIIAYFAYNALSDRYVPAPDAQIRTEDVTPSTVESTADTALTTGTVETTQEETKYIAPDFTVYDAAGNEVKLSDFLGKPVVLNFWASWCPPCKEEMPYFNEVYLETKDDVVFMMVDLNDGQRETQEKAHKYIDDKGFEFPVYFDTDADAAMTYGISSIPTTLFIDTEGYILKGYQGSIKKKTIEDAIVLLLD